MRFIILKAMVPSVIKSRIYCSREREEMSNVYFNDCEDHQHNTLSSLRGTSPTKAKIILWEILNALPQILQVGKRCPFPRGSRGLI